jgi:hypothetical protein
VFIVPHSRKKARGISLAFGINQNKKYQLISFWNKKLLYGLYFFYKIKKTEEKHHENTKK